LYLPHRALAAHLTEGPRLRCAARFGHSPLPGPGLTAHNAAYVAPRAAIGKERRVFTQKNRPTRPPFGQDRPQPLPKCKLNGFPRTIVDERDITGIVWGGIERLQDENELLTEDLVLREPQMENARLLESLFVGKSQSTVFDENLLVATN